MTRIPTPAAAASGLLALALLAAAPQAGAAGATLQGTLPFHNSQVLIDLTLAAPGRLTAWTDSWQGGLNVAPLLSLFSPAGALLALDDDDEGDAVAPGQGFYDAGLALDLGAGTYRLVLTAAPNAPLGTRLAEGFAFDAQAPIPVPRWDQPSFDLNRNDQKGTLWRVQLDGVQQAAVVPEPGTVALWLAGLAAVGALAGRRGRGTSA